MVDQSVQGQVETKRPNFTRNPYSCRDVDYLLQVNPLMADNLLRNPNKNESAETTKMPKLNLSTKELEALIDDISLNVRSFNYKNFSAYLRSEENPKIKKALLSSKKIKKAFGEALSSNVFNGPDAICEKWANSAISFLNEFGLAKDVFKDKRFLNQMKNDFPHFMCRHIYIGNIILSAMEDAGCKNEIKSILSSKEACDYMAEGIKYSIQAEAFYEFVTDKVNADMNNVLEFGSYWFDMNKVLTPENLAKIRAQEVKTIEELERPSKHARIFKEYHSSLTK